MPTSTGLELRRRRVRFSKPIGQKWNRARFCFGLPKKTSTR